MPGWTFVAAQVLRATLQARGDGGAAAGDRGARLRRAGARLDLPRLRPLRRARHGDDERARHRPLPLHLDPDAASTVAPFTVVLLAFISGVWIPVDQLPHWLESIAKIFPLYHLALGLQTSLAPDASGSGLNAGNLAVLAAWAAGGAWVAIRRFRWEPLAARE